MKIECWYCGQENCETEKVCCLCRRPVTRDTSGKHEYAKTSEQAKPVGVASDNIAIGKSIVKVYRKDWDEMTKREKTHLIHEGIVVGQNSRMLRVFNPAPLDKGGDPSAEMSQYFPLASPRCWCEIVGCRTVSFPIPPTLR